MASPFAFLVIYKDTFRFPKEVLHNSKMWISLQAINYKDFWKALLEFHDDFQDKLP